MATKIYNGMEFDSDRHYSTGETHKGNLTGFGEQFIKTGVLQGYGYVKGGATGRFGKKASGGAYETLRAALASGDLNEIVKAAQKLPTVIVRIDTSRPGNANYGFKVSRKGCVLFEAPYLGKA